MGRLCGRLAISIHAPRVGSDPDGSFFIRALAAFQSTLPVWGATSAHRPDRYCRGYFNPRSPCGERQPAQGQSCAPRTFQSTLPVWGATWISSHIAMLQFKISIHAPRVGSDLPTQGVIIRGWVFQSTLPVWGATLRIRCLFCGTIYFNPRSPCGERHETIDPGAFDGDFNPRSPCGERHG